MIRFSSLLLEYWWRYTKCVFEETEEEEEKTLFFSKSDFLIKEISSSILERGFIIFLEELSSFLASSFFISSQASRT